MKKGFLYYSHLIIPLSILSIPSLPIKYHKWVLLCPSILYSIWLLFDGCPWTQATSTNKEDDFILDMLRIVYPKLSKKKCDNVIGIVLTGVILISYYRLLLKIPKSVKL